MNHSSLLNLKLKFLFIQSFINLLLIQNVQSHSWVTCTDYKLPENYPTILTNDINNKFNNNSINYDLNQCSGYPRNYQLQFNSDKNRGFGNEANYNFRSQECKYSYDSNYYTPEIKMAEYNQGSQVCLTYPSKNHIASDCTNKNIIDNGVKIFRSKNKLSDDFSTEIKHLNGKHQEDTMDYLGFQNCPGFCNNPDKTVCYICFNLEDNIEPGIYSFKWIWQFNPNEYYSSCWDAQINNYDSNLEKPCTKNLRKLQSISYKYQKNSICNSISESVSTPALVQNSPTQSPTQSPTPTVTEIKKRCNSKPDESKPDESKPNESKPDESKPNENKPNESKPAESNENNKNAEIWDQCDGNGNNKKCKNSECIKFSPYYSQCLPYTLEKNMLCGQKDKKEINWMYEKCKNGLKCVMIDNSHDFRCL